jgi:hypothetical protein
MEGKVTYYACTEDSHYSCVGLFEILQELHSLRLRKEKAVPWFEEVINQMPFYFRKC